MDGVIHGGILYGWSLHPPDQLCLYLSHFLSAWGIRAFEFLVSLVLVQLYNDSLFMVALFGLLDSLAIVLSSPYLGRYVDRSERYSAASNMYFWQNIGTFVSSLGFWILLHRDEKKDGPVGVSFAVLCILSACISSVGAMGSCISVEREWTKSICGSNDGNILTRMNAIMKRIDLICLICSPIAVGILLETLGYMICLVTMCLYNIIAWVLECYALKSAIEYNQLLNQPVKKNNDAGGVRKVADLGLQDQLTVYMNQPFTYYAISLAMTYMTVISFGSTMTAFLAFSGVGEAILSLFRGFGAVCGVSATLIFPRISLTLGLEKTAMYSIIGQALLVFGAVASMIVLNSTHVANIVLLLFLSISRLFLWLFDLSVNQVIQENASNGTIGTVFGAQTALQYTFQTIAYTLTLLWPDPKQFLTLMIISVVFIFTSMCLTIFGYRKS